MSEEELIGQLLDRKYAIRGVIGRGGMGMVYEAENLGLGKLVAIKVLAQQAAGASTQAPLRSRRRRCFGGTGRSFRCRLR